MPEPIAVLPDQYLRYELPLMILVQATDPWTGHIQPALLADLLRHAINQSTDLLTVVVQNVAKDENGMIDGNETPVTLRVVSTAEDAYFEWITEDGDAISPPLYELYSLPQVRKLTEMGLGYPIRSVLSSPTHTVLATEEDRHYVRASRTQALIGALAQKNIKSVEDVNPPGTRHLHVLYQDGTKSPLHLHLRHGGIGIMEYLENNANHLQPQTTALRHAIQEAWKSSQGTANRSDVNQLAAALGGLRRC